MVTISKMKVPGAWRSTGFWIIIFTLWESLFPQCRHILYIHLQFINISIWLCVMIIYVHLFTSQQQRDSKQTAEKSCRPRRKPITIVAICIAKTEMQGVMGSCTRPMEQTTKISNCCLQTSWSILGLPYTNNFHWLDGNFQLSDGQWDLQVERTWKANHPKTRLTRATNTFQWDWRPSFGLQTRIRRWTPPSKWLDKE